MREKKEKEQLRKIKETNFSVTNVVNVNFRQYAFYVLENRGIPSFYDAITNVQRFILMNSPRSLNGTLSVIGSSISSGYHHGDASIAKAINKVTKEFGCSENFLTGDGFFGSPVKTDASAARYTKVKLNPTILPYLDKYSVLNKKKDESFYDYIRSEIPLGLLTSIVGIGVGYASTVLPRSIKDITDYLNGKKVKLNPYFKNYNGKISPVAGKPRSWLFEGVMEFDDKKKEINVTELPPLMRYDAFINKKLSSLLEANNFNFLIQNDSKDTINITLKWKGGDSWELFKAKIENLCKLVVTETIIFIKDSQVIEYNSISDYLNEFRIQRELNRLEKSTYDKNQYSEELEFLKAKKLYLEFMILKKRKDSEIETFISAYSSNISSRLLRIYLRDLNPEAIIKTQTEIDHMILTLKHEVETEDALQKSVNELIKTLPERPKVARPTVALLEDDSEIEIFSGVDEMESEEDQDSENTIEE